MATNPTRYFRHYVSDAVTNVILEVSGTKVINQWNDFYQLRRADNTAQSFSNSLGLSSPSKATTLVYPGTATIEPFTQNGDRFYWNAGIINNLTGNGSTVGVSLTITTPLGIETIAHVNMTLNLTLNGATRYGVLTPIIRHKHSP